MQSLTLEERAMVDELLLSGRQWKRSDRIGYAKRQLKLSYRGGSPSAVLIAKTVLRRVDYDYIDKASAKERP